jgi:hypothetical protein
MKPDEAIKILEVAKAECEWNAPLEYQEAFDAAIEALEKQIPKKSCSTSSLFRYNCPSCGNHFPLNGKYCDKCGQAIDWE